MYDNSQDPTQPQSPVASQPPQTQSAPPAPTPPSAEDMLTQLIQEGNDPAGTERHVEFDESNQAAEALIKQFRTVLGSLSAYQEAKTKQKEQNTPFAVFTNAGSAYAVFDETDEDGTQSLVIKRLPADQKDSPALQDFSPSEGATQVLITAFAPEGNMEATIAFESPVAHWTMKDTAGNEFPWPIQNTTLAIAKTAALLNELKAAPQTPTL